MGITLNQLKTTTQKIKTYTDGLLSTANGRIDTVETTANTATTNIGTMASLTTTEKTSLVGAINELVTDFGTVDGKITNKIAEVVAGAPEDFDTLKEMADWISGHETDVIGMNTSINTNKTNIGTMTELTTTEKGSLVGAINELVSASASVTYTDEQVAAAVDEVLNPAA